MYVCMYNVDAGLVGFGNGLGKGKGQACPPDDSLCRNTSLLFE